MPRWGYKSQGFCFAVLGSHLHSREYTYSLLAFFSDHFTTLIGPLSLLCILGFFDYLSSLQRVFGDERSDEEGIYLYSSPKVFILPELYPSSSLHFSKVTSLRSVLGFLAAGCYCIGFCCSCFCSITLTNFCFLVKACLKAIATPCPCDLNVCPLCLLLKSSHICKHTPLCPSDVLFTKPTGL